MNSQLVERAKQEKWKRGDLTYKLHTTQKIINKAFNESNDQLFVGNCSRQLGKTYWAVIKALECALSKPKSQIRYGAAFQSDLVDYIIPAFEKAMEDCPDDLKGHYKTQGNKFVFPNGSIIKLVGLDKKPNGLRGNTLDLIILDECGFVSRLTYLYESIIIPATTHRPDARVILISTPPATPAHSFLDYCMMAEQVNSYSKFTIFSNTMLDSNTILRLMRGTGCSVPFTGNEHKVIKDIMKSGKIVFPPEWIITTTFKREYLCEFITDTDLQIIPEWKDEFVLDVPKDEYYGFYHKYVGMDLGVKDFTALVFSYYDFKHATLVIEDEITMHGPSMNTILLVDAIKAKEQSLWLETPPFRRISDNNNLHLLQDMSSIHQLYFTSTNKDTLEAMINEVRIMVQAGRIKVNPRCKQLIGCLKYGVWNEKKTVFARSSTYGHFDHLAALIYLVRNLATNSNPVPKDYGFQNHTAWLGNIQNGGNAKSDNAQALIKALIPNKKKFTY